VTTKLREYAILLRRWEAFELGGQAPARLEYLDLAKEVETAIGLIRDMRIALAPFALDPGAESLSKALGHITREDLLRADRMFKAAAPND
jgi:hypothetical protein